MNDPVKFTLSDPVHLVALGFGSGLLKPAPGTWGTLAAVPFYLVAVAWLPATLPAYLAFILLSFVVGVYVCGKTASDVGAHDHGSIVWDEFVGLFITLIAVPPTWLNVVVGFVLFRIFDILKPWPIKLLDRHVHGGFGIMIDDVLAGVFAGLILFFAQPYLTF
ncbi:phosphatidylglycerophosphatase A family protein [Arenicella xantha]|uniref:Phosphatidylglycerophosphatase A n=1 Tax=Arenicella xantha TaxID=644221 RepID=A0A395JPZ7_9GAMM|nr:phosphatidylglycerophosphatase A [Arenicella xantha]RBP50780.1 phosphatidylglycerophosphatase A [Arenicella xantha]